MFKKANFFGAKKGGCRDLVFKNAKFSSAKRGEGYIGTYNVQKGEFFSVQGRDLVFKN